MKKEKTEVGDIRIGPLGKKPQLCIEGIYRNDGSNKSTWVDYELYLLQTTLGMSPDSHELFSLQHFVDVLAANTLSKEKKERETRCTSLSDVLSGFHHGNTRKERTEIGDLRINTERKKTEVCVEVGYLADGSIQSEWMDYDTCEDLLVDPLMVRPGGKASGTTTSRYNIV